MDEPSWPSCIIECNVPGMVKAKQKQKETLVRSNRIIAATIESPRFKKPKDLSSLTSGLVNEILNPFISYTLPEKKNFTITGKNGPVVALNIIKKLMINANNT